MNNRYYIGLDEHKDLFTIAYINSSCRKNAIYHETYSGSDLALERALRKLIKLLKAKLQDLKVCYEAGTTKFVLERRLIQPTAECVLCSSSQTERKPDDKIKTDNRDVQKLAKIHVPTSRAMRDSGYCSASLIS